MRRLVLASAAALALAHPAAAQGPALVAPTGPLSPADELAGFQLPPGFVAQLVASEPEIQKPMQMAWDAKGRLWVTTSFHYPFAVESNPTDKVFVLSDFDANGRAKKVQTFAADLNIPIGILPLPDCKSVLVSSVGEIRLYKDADMDGVSESHEVLYKGFGSRDTHGMYNSYTLMPDGWVYACHGFANDSTVRGKDGHEVKMQSGHTFRFKTDGSRIEVVSRGQVNPFGMAVDPWFNLYTADCHSKPITQIIPGAYYQSFGKPHDGLGFAPHVTAHDHNSTGLCGLSWYEAKQFPDRFRGCMFVGNVVTSRINFDKIEWRGATPVAKELPDFLVSKDPWFRPVDIKLGPDGALYVNDFYNKIIGHYEVDLKHPGRDKTRGRLWRIVYKGDAAEPPPVPKYDLTTAPDAELFGLLTDPSFTNRMLAGNQLLRRARDGKQPQPGDALGKGIEINDHLSAVVGWTAFIENASGNSIPADRYREMFRSAEAQKLQPDQFSTLVLRSLTARPKWEAGERAALLDALKTFDVPHVRRAAAEAMTAHPHADFVAPLVGMLKTLPPGDEMTRYSARVALRNCLRDADGWKSVAAADVPVVTDVALGVPSAESARFLAGALDKAANDGQREAMAFHVGRFGDLTERKAVYAAAPTDQARGLTLLREMLKGMAAGGKSLTDGESEAKAYYTLAGASIKAPPTNPGIARGLVEVFSALEAASAPPDRPANAALAQTLFLQLAGNAAVPAEGRGLAIEGIGRFNSANSAKALAGLVADAKTPTALKEKAVVALSNVNHPDARSGLKEALKGQPYRVAVAVAQNMAGSKGGAAGLFAEVKGGTIPARVLQEKVVVERLRAAKVDRLDPQLAELTKGLPPADARLVQVIRERADAIARAPGDAAEGAKVFVKHCAACHQIGTVGNRVGPQLDGVGIRGLERLLEDVLDPNRNIDAAFRARVLTLVDGTTKTGLQLRAEGQVLVFADNEGKEFRLAAKEIETNRETNLSPMPANVAELVPEAEFRHLMTYLLAQRVAEVPKK
ncbi:MAG: PVC-type heme-binding CxxCH protein [Gemmataceae bacterium]